MKKYPEIESGRSLVRLLFKLKVIGPFSGFIAFAKIEQIEQEMRSKDFR